MRSYALLLALCLLSLLSLSLSQPSPPSFPGMPGQSDSDSDDAFSIYQMPFMPSSSAFDTDAFYGAAASAEDFDVMGITEDGDLVSLGKKGSFHMPQPLAMLHNAPQYEQLPTITKDTQYLKPVVRTQYIDQEIIQVLPPLTRNLHTHRPSPSPLSPRYAPLCVRVVCVHSPRRSFSPSCSSAWWSSRSSASRPARPHSRLLTHAER